MATELHDTLKFLTNKPEIAFQYQDDASTPWSSIVGAHNGVEEAYRAPGKIRFIDQGDGKGVIEYWYKGGIELENLVPRYENLESAAAYVEILEGLKADVQIIKSETEAFKNESLNAAQAAIEGIGNLNATTGIATIIETGISYTPTVVANQANGKYFDVVVAGTLVITGTTIAMEIGGIVISRGTKWDYIPKSSLAIENLNGTKILDSGATTGIVIPESQYLHQRGDDELKGNFEFFGSTYTILGAYKQSLNAVAFNKVRIFMNTPIASEIIVRVYKSATFQTNPANMSLLAEKSYAAGDFNLLGTQAQLIDLGSSIIRVKPTEYVYILLHSTTAGRLRMRAWNVDASESPLRDRFFVGTSDTPWVTAMTVSSGANFTAGFELLQILPSDYEKYVRDNLIGISVDQNTGRSGGIFIPSIPYEHPRGDSEIIGNAVYTGGGDTGFGFYEQIPKASNFNKIELGLQAINTQAVAVRIYKSKNFGTSVPALTLLESLTYPVGTFNASANKTIIHLANHHSIGAGEYVYILAVTASTNGLRIRHFSNSANDPVRHSFLRFRQVSDPWTSSWEASVVGSGYYQSGIRLFNIESNPLVDERLNIAEQKITENTTSISGAVTKGSDGKISAAYLPSIVYNHPRGDSEINGNQTFFASFNTGMGFLEQYTTDTVFNKVDIPAFVTKTTGDITIKIAIGNSVNGNVQSFTELHSQTIQANSFNKKASSLHTIILDTPLKVTAGSYLYIYIIPTLAGSISIKYWNVDAASPTRKRFIYTTSSTPSTATWEISSGAFYTASFRLSLVNATLDRKVIILENTRPPRTTLVSRLYAVVGMELSVYYDALIYGQDNGLAMSPDYFVQVSCGKGTRYDRFWRVKPVESDVGQHNFYVDIFDRNGFIVESKSAVLYIIPATGASLLKYLLQVGDSITNDGNSRIAINERKAQLTGGVPFELVGSLGSGSAKHEGHSGWQWVNFTNDGATAPAPAGNPFWNPNTSAIDFAYYRSQIGQSALIDVFSFQLGVNDARRAKRTEAENQASINYAKTIFTAVLADNPNAKIIIQLPTTDANTQYAGTAQKGDYQYNIWRIRELIIETFDRYTFHANVHVGQVGLCLDRYYGYPFTNNVSADRYTETEIVHTNDVHPRTQGYKQMGDAIFPQILALLQ